jgi:hypothetical protein
MNYWLCVLADNHLLATRFLAQISQRRILV